MYIQEAIREAEKFGGGVIRKSIDGGELAYRRTVIMPSDTYDCCKMETYTDGKKVSSCRCWNPTKNDLLADDWIVIKV